MCVYINVVLYQNPSRITINFKIFCQLFLKNNTVRLKTSGKML